MPLICESFNHVFEVFQGLFFAFILWWKNALGSSLSVGFQFSNSETVKAVNLVFCKLSIANIPIKFSVSNLFQSSDIRWNLDGAISNSRVSGQSLINKKRHIFRISNDTDRKLEPVNKLDKKNTITLKILTMTLWRQIMMSVLFFQLMVDFQ